MTGDTLTRRTLVKAMAAGAASAALAGCSSSGGGGGGDGDDGGDSGDDGSNTEQMDFGGWFDDVSNYDGVVDKTGQSEVTVKVGAEGNNGAYAFGPAAIKVSTGTKVVWEWTGKGSFHNVVADNGDFKSEQKREEGYTFSQKFDSAGKYKYYCTPHKAMGMKGAIVVE